MSLLLMGLLGSWYFISATSSFRKVSEPIWFGRSTDVVAVVVATEAAAPDVDMGVLTGSPLSFRRARPRRATWIGWNSVRSGCLRYRQSGGRTGSARRTSRAGCPAVLASAAGTCATP